MPRRKRHDPEVSAPIDGDYDRLRVVNKDKALDYKWCDADDAARLKYEGYSPVTRREGGERAAHDLGGNDGETLTVGGMVLLAAPKAIAQRIDARSKATFDDTRAVLQADIRKAGATTDPRAFGHAA